AALQGFLLDGVINQDAPHHLGRHSEEMRAVLPTRVLPVNQPQVGFLYEGSGLQNVIRAFLRHVTLGQSSQLGLYYWDELGKGFSISLAPGYQQFRDFCEHNSLSLEPMSSHLTGGRYGGRALL